MRSFFLTILFFNFSALAYVPEISHLLRFQPHLLKEEKAFIVAGTVKAEGNTYPYSLKWLAPQKYQVVLENLPMLLTGEEGAENTSSSNLILTRVGANCEIRLYKLSIDCGSMGPWAAIELGGSPELSNRTFQEAGIVGNESTRWKESHSKNEFRSPSEKNIRLGSLSLGGRRVAIIAVGPQVAKLPNSGLSLAAPAAFFNQNFLFPLKLNLLKEDGVVEINANFPTHVEKEQPRFSSVLSSRLEIKKGEEVLFLLQRNTRKKPLTQKDLTKTTGSISLATLLEQLNSKGKNLVESMLYTH